MLVKNKQKANVEISTSGKFPEEVNLQRQKAGEGLARAGTKRKKRGGMTSGLFPDPSYFFIIAITVLTRAHTYLAVMPTLFLEGRWQTKGVLRGCSPVIL